MIEKGTKTKYTVEYVKWNKINRGKVQSDQPLNAILPLLNQEQLVAEPIKDEKDNSSWLISNTKNIKKLKDHVGHSNYRARKGVDFSLNGLYWGKIIKTSKLDKSISEYQLDIRRKS